MTQYSPLWSYSEYAVTELGKAPKLTSRLPRSFTQTRIRHVSIRMVLDALKEDSRFAQMDSLPSGVSWAKLSMKFKKLKVYCTVYKRLESVANKLCEDIFIQWVRELKEREEALYPRELLRQYELEQLQRCSKQGEPIVQKIEINDPDIEHDLQNLEREIRIWEKTIAEFNSQLQSQNCDETFVGACLNNLQLQLGTTRAKYVQTKLLMESSKKIVTQSFEDECSFCEEEEMEIHQMFCVVAMMADLEKSISNKLSTNALFNKHKSTFWSCSNLPSFALLKGK